MELAKLDTPRMTSTAGDWTGNARPLVLQLIEQGLTMSMIQELTKEMMKEVEW